MAKQERLDNDEFLSRLSKYLNTHSTDLSGSIHLTQKRLTPPDHQPAPQDHTLLNAPFPDTQPSEPFAVLLRATNGKSASASSSSAAQSHKSSDSRRKSSSDKWKIATVVQPDELDAFFVRYGEVWRREMSALKKRDRKKKKRERKGGPAAT